MQLLVLGRGKTGSLVAEVARERGHDVSLLGGADNADGSALTPSFITRFHVVIDFTTPDAVPVNLDLLLPAGARVVVGTTGWYQHLPTFCSLAQQHNAFLLHGTNFSIGVQALFRAARVLAGALPAYTFSIRETHHAGKKDAPSGTALTLQRVVQQELSDGQVPIQSTRHGNVPGLHVLAAQSENDLITLQHESFSRRGFAEGAVRAAEWLILQENPGVWDFSDVAEALQ